MKKTKKKEEKTNIKPIFRGIPTKTLCGFKKSTLPITDYTENMNSNIEKLKRWLKEFKEPLPYEAINLAELIEQSKEPTRRINVKFETDTIKIELKENDDKELLKKLLDLWVKIPFGKALAKPPVASLGYFLTQ